MEERGKAVEGESRGHSRASYLVAWATLETTVTAAFGTTTGNRHVFPIDILLLERRMAIAGARAIKLPPGRMREDWTICIRREHEQS